MFCLVLHHHSLALKAQGPLSGRCYFGRQLVIISSMMVMKEVIEN